MEMMGAGKRSRPSKQEKERPASPCHADIWPFSAWSRECQSRNSRDLCVPLLVLFKVVIRSFRFPYISLHFGLTRILRSAHNVGQWVNYFFFSRSRAITNHRQPKLCFYPSSHTQPSGPTLSLRSRLQGVMARTWADHKRKTR